MANQLQVEAVDEGDSPNGLHQQMDQSADQAARRRSAEAGPRGIRIQAQIPEHVGQAIPEAEHIDQATGPPERKKSRSQSNTGQIYATSLLHHIWPQVQEGRDWISELRESEQHINNVEVFINSVDRTTWLILSRTGDPARIQVQQDGERSSGRTRHSQ
jgi:hypothetical protein